ncbi:transposase [Mesorhizobium sp. WSM3626]|uniref:transposase n=1 Tax=Mesorhizobium sp. WSM3626 TaxID=1040987 RepID=UPI0012EB18C7|nr:transposase [Mesorhizobium sp. WSM3626]
MPGIGPVTALTYRATIDDAKRFRRSEARTALFEAQRHPAPDDPMVEHEGSGNEDCQSTGCPTCEGRPGQTNGSHLHRMWVDEQDFRWSAA